MGERLGHRPAFDGLRGVAILLVLGVHIGGLLLTSLGTFTRGGVVGVDVFFVLSGFLITTLLLEERERSGTISFRRFYARRALRLLPALVVLLAAHTLYAMWQHADLRLEARTIVVVLLYSSNWWYSLGRELAPGFVHTWSLANEEQFYLVWPVALALVMPRLRARAVPALLTAAACVIAIRVVLWANGSYEASVWSATFGRFDAMFLGAALAYAWRDGRVRAALFSPHAAVAGGIAIVLMLPMDKTALAYGGYTVASLGAVAIIGAVLVNDSRWLSAALENRPIRAIGRISYALYLWQFPVFTVVHDDVRAGTGVKLVLALSVTFAAAIASTLLVERPFLTLKRRFAAARPTTTAEEAGAAPLAQDFAPARAN